VCVRFLFMIKVPRLTCFLFPENKCKDRLTIYIHVKMLCFSIPHSTCIKKIRNKTKNFSKNEANRKLNIESFFPC
jgi:hypothetical protein